MRSLSKYLAPVVLTVGVLFENLKQDHHGAPFYIVFSDHLVRAIHILPNNAVDVSGVQAHGVRGVRIVSGHRIEGIHYTSNISAARVDMGSYDVLKLDLVSLFPVMPSLPVSAVFVEF